MLIKYLIINIFNISLIINCLTGDVIGYEALSRISVPDSTLNIDMT